MLLKFQNFFIWRKFSAIFAEMEDFFFNFDENKLNKHITLKKNAAI